MSEVTHLSADFYEEVGAIAAQLQGELTEHQYWTFRHYLREGDLVGATHHLRHIAKAWERTRTSPLGQSHPDRHEHFMVTVRQWRRLMKRNGGPKRATKLVKKADKKLPAPKLPPFGSEA